MKSTPTGLRARRSLLSTTALTASIAIMSGPAFAAPAIGNVGPDAIVQLAALIGVLTFGVFSAIALVRSRNAAEGENARLRADTAALKAEADRAEALVNASEDRIVAWEGAGAAPIVAGGMPRIEGMPEDRARFLAFGSWLSPESASALDRALTPLRDHGESFRLSLATEAGHLLEVFGRTVGGRAVIRFRDLSGDRRDLAELESQQHALAAEVETLRRALELASVPVWLRTTDGRLVWVNKPYADAVEATLEVAISANLELLASEAREASRTMRAAGNDFRQRATTIVHGQRRVFDVAEVAGAGLTGGIAIDATEADAARAALDRMIRFHTHTLDQLAAGVAVFGADRRLRSYNSAYRDMFGLDVSFLESSPEEGEILDRLRASRKLPEQADFRSWKADILSAYQAVESKETLWPLPDRQMLRVISNPHPEGGVTWIYENVTERLDLESRYNALARVQGETIDNLSEAVAVFGSDGRLRLHNPAFRRVWSFDQTALAARPHITDIARLGRRLHDDETVWRQLTQAVAGVDETRGALAGRMERKDGRIIDYATVPLPDGQTMLTFVDTSASVQVERALTERNEALEAADGLKNAFIHHVSYELRSPLTNIIGFAQLLADSRIGTLNPKQREYTDYIMASGDSLLAIVNDILDLATVDAGIMELDLGPVDVVASIAAAAEGVRDRVNEAGIRLETHVPAEIGTFIGDEKRVRQMLYNLLSNAVRYSTSGGKVAVSAIRRGEWMEFVVEDEGTGMPADFVPLAFRPFESRGGGAARGGAGLGLSIVKSFADLHGGEIDIQSQEGKGTRVTLRLPVRAQRIVDAAE